jgi:hypothetical protein
MVTKFSSGRTRQVYEFMRLHRTNSMSGSCVEYSKSHLLATMPG